MIEWTSLSYVVVDVEGNGQQPPDVVEFAAVPIVGGIVGEPRSWLVRPEAPITPIARRFHGITNEQLQDAPTFASVEADVREALSAQVLIAHHAPVDVGLLRRKLGGWQCPEVIHTLKLARRLLPGRATTNSVRWSTSSASAATLMTRCNPTGLPTTCW